MAAEPTVFCTIHVDAAAGLAQLNKVVKRYERNVGALIGMGIDDGMTTLKFESTTDRPLPAAVIAPGADGAAADGATVVATGMIYIESAEVPCRATRG